MMYTPVLWYRGSYRTKVFWIFIRHKLTATSIGELFLDNKQLHVYSRYICHNKNVKDVQNFGKYSFPIYNKRPMGHIAHLRKQLKSINTYDYIITLIKRRKKPLLSLWELNGSSFEQNWIPFTKGCFVLSLFQIDPVVLEKKIF